MLLLKTILFIIQIISTIAIIGFILLQKGKGAETGFANISSDSLFGAKGSANFLSRATAIVATIFFISTLSIVAVDNKITHSNDLGVMNASTDNQHITHSADKNSIPVVN